MRKGYLYRAKINKTTEANCNRWLDICRRLYNLALEQRISVYRQYKKSISVYEQMRQLPQLKAEFPEFKDVGSQVLQDVLQRLDKAFISFFNRLKERKGKAGFPRFKGRNRYDSFMLKQAGWRLEGRFLYIKNVGRFKLFLSRPIEGDIKTITVRRSSSGKWFVAFSCDNVPIRKYPQIWAYVGIDMGIDSFCVDSRERRIKNPEYLRQSERLLRRRQRSLGRRRKGSNRRNKARILVAKTHEKVSNQRKDFLHKVSNYYIWFFKFIYIEELNIKGMVKNRYLAKSISDVSWGMFVEFLMYKAEEAGRQIISVPSKDTSQRCSCCGEIVPKSLYVRVHNCPYCGLVLDRDLNASFNILRFGQNRQTLTPAKAGVV